MSSRLSDALDAVGARLKRDKKHRVYELPNGRTFVVSSTPSDVRAEQNAMSNLRAVAGVDVVERRKASAEVRSERRRRPGRNGETPWAPPVNDTIGAALLNTGIVERQLRAQVDELTSGVRDLADAVDDLSAAIRARDEHIATLEALWFVRLWRSVSRREVPVHHDAVARCFTKWAEPSTRA